MPFWCFQRKVVDPPRPGTPGRQSPIALVRISTPILQHPASRPGTPAGTLRIATPLIRNTISRPQTPSGTPGISTIPLRIATPVLQNTISRPQTPSGTPGISIPLLRNTTQSPKPPQNTTPLNHTPPGLGNQAVNRYLCSFFPSGLHRRLTK